MTKSKKLQGKKFKKKRIKQTERRESNKKKIFILHVSFLVILIGVLVDAVLLSALPVHPKESADWHPCLVVLVEEPAGIAFHAQTPQPMPAHRLPEATPLVPSGGARSPLMDPRPD